MEVGEEVNVAKLLDGHGNWKGRAQQISILKDRVKELSSRTSLHGQPAMPGLGSEDTGGKSSANYDQKHKDSIKKIELVRRQDVERLNSEIESLKYDYQDIKRKLDAATARNRCLEKEINDYRGKIQILVTKDSKDNMLIRSLQEELRLSKSLGGGSTTSKLESKYYKELGV
ncbi:Coiled-coil domain-containing protein 13 [Irineochytrium annulatum]|nr:Coiled-coil domain-containing protein 13 [Irineochytrium annulatum]